MTSMFVEQKVRFFIFFFVYNTKYEKQYRVVFTFLPLNPLKGDFPTCKQ